MNKRCTMVRLITLHSDLVTVEPDDLSGSLVMHSPDLVTTQVPSNGHGSGVKRNGPPRRRRVSKDIGRCRQLPNGSKSRSSN